MKEKQLSLFLLSIIILSGNSAFYALSPDGEALWKFKTGIKTSDGVLSYWREEDADPCHWPGVTCDGHSRRVIHLNLPFHKLSGYLSPSLGKLDKLRKLGLHHNNLFGTIPPDLGNCSHLRALHLEMNYLSGHIPGELGKLSRLVIMDISSNSLSGKIPVSFGNLQKLTMFNVSTNFLSGDIPDNGVMKKFNEKSFVGNLALCGQQVDAICLSQLQGPTTSPDSFTTPIIGLEGAPISGSRKKALSLSTQLLVSAIGTVGISLLVALMCFWGWFLYHKFYKKPKLAEDDAIVGMLDTPKVVFFHGDLPYSSKEILRKIEMLNESCIIGCGGFGTVYKLVMDDGSTFAVKKIEKRSCGPYALFETELEVLGSVKHRNLVNIRGYCNSPFVRLLIYDYLSKGSLEQGLHEEDSLGFPLSWPERLKIALGTAQGLAYLHHDCSPRIIHCDIKSSNILLGENLEPRVSDFGLAKLLEDNYSHVTTVVAGTFGYLAPEYLQNGRATEKTDVYSYGVVLLELLSGKRPNDPTFVEKGLNMVGWVNTLLKENNLRLIVDPSCEDVSMPSLEAMISIATMCVKPVPDERPSMCTIVKMLEAEIIPPCTSGFYDSNSE